MFGTCLGAADDQAGLLRALGGILHCRGDLFQSGSGFLNGCCLLFGTLGQIVGGRFDLVCARADATGILRNPGQCRLQLFGGHVEVVTNAVECRRERLADAVGHIAIRKLRKTGRQIVDGKFDVGSFLGLLLLARDAFLFRKAAIGFGLLFKADALDRTLAEHLNGNRHLANFVLAVHAIDLGCRIAACQRHHTLPQPGNRRCDATRGHEKCENDAGCKADANHNKRGQDRGIRLATQIVAACRNTLGKLVQQCRYDG